jgi:hypothetical protein
MLALGIETAQDEVSDALHHLKQKQTKLKIFLYGG